MTAGFEERAADNADRLLNLIERGQRENLRTWIDGLSRTDLAWMVLALGQGLLTHEAEAERLTVKNAILRRQNETLDTANVNLFREKRELLEKVRELRSYLDQHASSLPKRSAARVAGRKAT